MGIEPDKRKLFEDCVKQCADSIYRVAYRLIGKDSLAKDLVQETYLNAWRNLASLKDPDKMRSWLFSILRNQYSKWVRKESQMVKASELIDVPVDSDDSSTGEDIDQVQLAIGKLPDHYRLPVLLVSLEQMAVEEAAEVLNLPKGTVLSRLHRGREKLKSILSSEFAGT